MGGAGRRVQHDGVGERRTWVWGFCSSATNVLPRRLHAPPCGGGGLGDLRLGEGLGGCSSLLNQRANLLQIQLPGQPVGRSAKLLSGGGCATVYHLNTTTTTQTPQQHHDPASRQQPARQGHITVSTQAFWSSSSPPLAGVGRQGRWRRQGS